MLRIITITAVLLVTCTRVLMAVEPWSDKNLPVQEGLEIWLDAGTQNAARSATNLPELKANGAIDRWLDASGKARHLIQHDKESQPVFLSDGKRAAIRFDGRKQCFVNQSIGASSDAVTVFIVGTPYGNSGGFRAFAAANRENQNDFTSGWTLDMGPFRSERLETINPEGIGFGGARNLLKDADDFGILQRFCMVSRVGSQGTQLFVNNQLQGSRERTASAIEMDQLTVGARCYNFGASPVVQGFLNGELAELLIYSRALTNREREQVDDYLMQKHGNRRKVAIPPRGAGKMLVRIKNPPPVQFLVAGFSVFELPPQLPNINNVRYRPDGKLLAVAYNGNIYLLSDNNGDGLEEHVELFFENKTELRGPIGMALTPADYGAGQGVFIASKGKCSLILDRDGDDRADDEVIIATGWKELPHNVDSLGVAVDPRDGSIYFGLGTENFTNPYLVEPGGEKSQYRLTDEHGTIQRVTADFQHRETVCTGIRFPVGLAFNAAGDLFCTDQEGATWLSNGNPFDELLHIERGRHYGFPPRHPRFLPDVIDEPSTFDFRPQHQSTCGLYFNEAAPGGKTFGPENWAGNAITCGYSRGKLYRTELVKTASGYVARNHLIASVSGLAVDACVSRSGEMVLATHSGAPDWGSGPQGMGKLYKIRYDSSDVPQPVQVWSPNTNEVRIAFDRPLPLGNSTTSKDGRRALAAAIDFGEAVAAGDRYEILRPGYQVVQDQLDTIRSELPVHSVQLLPDARTLILATGDLSRPVPHAVTLSGLLWQPPEREHNELPQLGEIDLQFDLCGVQAEWQSKSGDRTWSGWLPHLDLSVARQFAAGNAGDFDTLWRLANEPGVLTLRTQLKLVDMLRPAIQPGSVIDYTWPQEEVTVQFVSNRAFQLNASDTARISTTASNANHQTAITVQPKPNQWTTVEIQLRTGDGETKLTVAWSTNEDSRPRSLSLHRMLLPWARTEEPSKNFEPRERPELAGGNWARGRQLFFDEQVGCGKCHQFDGEGGTIGPQLSNLPFRDYQSVVRDITQPSVSFNPDFLPYSLALIDGRVLAGTVRNDGDFIHIGSTNGTSTKVHRDEVEQMTASSVSIMPEGIVKQLGDDRFKDLMTFLLSPPPRMPDYGPLEPPAPRTQAEVDAVLDGSDATAATRPIEIVLVAGRKDHGPGEHDYPAWQRVWERLLSRADHVTVSTANDWPSPQQIQSANVLVFYQQGRWTPERARDLDAFFERGGGAVYLHYAVDGGEDPQGFADRIGLAWQGGRSAFRHGPLDVDFRQTDHPISRNFDQVHFHDESYWRLVGPSDNVKLLGTGIEEQRPQPLFWTFEPGQGRVFVSILGHFSWTFDDPLFRVLILRGIAWTAEEPVDRFHRLVRVGSRLQ